LAALNGHLGVVKYLINQKADINAKTENIVSKLLKVFPFIMLLKVVI